MLQDFLECVSWPNIVIVNVAAFLDFLGQLFLPLPSTLGSSKLLTMSIQRVSHGLEEDHKDTGGPMLGVQTDLYALIVQLQTVRYPLSKDFADLRTIPALLAITFHPSLLMHDTALDNTIPNSFTDNVLCVFLGIKVEFEANISQRYP